MTCGMTSGVSTMLQTLTLTDLPREVLAHIYGSGLSPRDTRNLALTCRDARDARDEWRMSCGMKVTAHELLPVYNKFRHLCRANLLLRSDDDVDVLLACSDRVRESVVAVMLMSVFTAPNLDRHQLSLCGKLPHVRTVIWYGHNHIDSTSLQQLHLIFPEVTSLNLISCSLPGRFLRCESLGLANLKFFSLERCTLSNSETLNDLLYTCRDLHTLRLPRWDEHLTDWSPLPSRVRESVRKVTAYFNVHIGGGNYDMLLAVLNDLVNIDHLIFEWGSHEHLARVLSLPLHLDKLEIVGRIFPCRQDAPFFYYPRRLTTRHFKIYGSRYDEGFKHMLTEYIGAEHSDWYSVTDEYVADPIDERRFLVYRYWLPKPKDPTPRWGWKDYWSRLLLLFDTECGRLLIFFLAVFVVVLGSFVILGIANYMSRLVSSL